nr:MAG TPA: hypothetical protein [Caudoviricetes sp.]
MRSRCVPIPALFCGREQQGVPFLFFQDGCG